MFTILLALLMIAVVRFGPVYDVVALEAENNDWAGAVFQMHDAPIASLLPTKRI
jgi:hypothetical protein